GGGALRDGDPAAAGALSGAGAGAHGRSARLSAGQAAGRRNSPQPLCGSRRRHGAAARPDARSVRAPRARIPGHRARGHRHLTRQDATISSARVTFDPDPIPENLTIDKEHWMNKTIWTNATRSTEHAQETDLVSLPHDVLRRRLMLGAMSAGIGTLFPWEEAFAQVVDKSTLAIAYPVDMPTWDPCAVSIPTLQCVYQTVFDSPLRYSPNLKLQPRQVKEWKWLDNKATRLEITLRDDILFHDGSRMTMEDVKYSLADRPKADKKLLIGGMLSTLADVEVQSATKGVLVYSRPNPAAPIYLGFLAVYIVPKAYMSQVGVD